MILYRLFVVAILKFSIGAVGGAPSYAPSMAEGRIAGGDVAVENQFPYQAGLSIEYLIGQYTWCGGSIIGDRWILTAAHCVDTVIGIIVYLGSVNRLAPTTTLALTPSHVVLHPHWDRDRIEHDIALLHLTVPIKFTSSIAAIQLPKLAATYSTYTYHEALTSGWGRMNDASVSISNVLRYVVRYTTSNTECQFIYGSSVRSTNICMDTTGGKSTCTGDSGGPLVVYDEGVDDMVLIGLTSFGKSAGCTNGYPAVFTRITAYLDWIHEMSGVRYL